MSDRPLTLAPWQAAMLDRYQDVDAWRMYARLTMEEYGISMRELTRRLGRDATDGRKNVREVLTGRVRSYRPRFTTMYRIDEALDAIVREREEA